MQAKPILRQSGFEPISAFGTGLSQGVMGDALQLKRRSQSADAARFCCKESARSALHSGNFLPDHTEHITLYYHCCHAMPKVMLCPGPFYV